MPVINLEVTIRPYGTSYAAEARLRQPGSAADAVLVANAALALDPATLLAKALDPTPYGQALTAQLFADPQLRDAWVRARALADGANLPLRLCLRLPAGSSDLHALRWETLRDPLTDRPLATDARLRLVRQLDSAETRPITVGPKPDLRALLVVASPRDLGAYGLLDIDVDGEVGRVRRALGAIPVTILGDHEDAAHPRATLGAIQAALRDGPTILCLICHGQEAGDDTVLWLEDEAGNTAHVPGRELSTMFAQCEQLPLLVLLIACDSGGALAALGPRLALAGVGAVVAMQTRLSITAARALLPALVRELASDGAIDRAMAVGRAALRDTDDWWVPAFWLRVREGRLWSEDAPAPTAPAGISVGGSVGTVQVVNVSGGSVGSIIGSQTNYGATPPPLPAASSRAEAVATQRQRLEQHRTTLAHYLGQLAITGSAHARPEVAAGIREARAGIARAKAALAALGETVDDMPDDTP